MRRKSKNYLTTGLSIALLVGLGTMFSDKIKEALKDVPYVGDFINKNL